MRHSLLRRWRALLVFALVAAAAPAAALADADQAPSPNSTSLGLQPLSGAIPQATPAPGESAVFQRPDGAYQAIPSKQRPRQDLSYRRARRAVDAQARA